MVSDGGLFEDERSEMEDERWKIEDENPWRRRIGLETAPIILSRRVL